MSNRRQNRIVVPGFTAKACFHIEVEEYRGFVQPYVNALQHVIQPSMKPGPSRCDTICDMCVRNGKRCCMNMQDNCYCC
jgi:hypothetical protein